MVNKPRHIVILGAGTAGTIMANRLTRCFASDMRRGTITITVVDQHDVHVYQPGLLFLPFGMYDALDIAKSRRAQLPEAVIYRQSYIERIDATAQRVVLTDRSVLPYDVLIVATGSRTAPERTEGMTGPGWGERVFDWYTLDGAHALGQALAEMQYGNLVIAVAATPIKCPVAPLEFAVLADWFFEDRGIRDRITISYVTPQSGACTHPGAARALARLLQSKNIELMTEFATDRIDTATSGLVSSDKREIPFDILAIVPVLTGAEFLRHTPELTNANGFVRTNARTLQSQLRPEIFALGDATDIPASKTGSVVHVEAEVVQHNVIRHLEGLPMQEKLDARARGFVETGFHKALMLDSNHDAEPVGNDLSRDVGPLTLLKDGQLNHLGKLAFKSVYWQSLLRGKDLPGIPYR